MTTHTVCYESLSNRAAANSGSLPHQSSASHHTGIAVSGTGAYALPRPEVPPSGYTTVPVARATLIEFGDTDIITEAWSDSASVSQNGSYVNNTTALLRKETVALTGFNSGRISPRVVPIFNGAAEPANATSIEAHIEYAHSDSNYMGVQHFCEFEDHPPDTNDNGAARLAQLELAFNISNNTYTLGEDSLGTPIIAKACGFAGIAPEGAIWIRPEDIGSGPDQIPSSTFTNTAEKFRAHPAVFYPAGRARYVRGLTRQAVDTVDIQSGAGNGGPLEITTVDAAPTSSNWLVSVDGQPFIVTLTHPDGSDFRRPRDIWNNVWVPIIQGASTIIASVQFASGGGNLGGIGFRWSYADYFRCLPLSGTNISQSGIG